MKHTETVSTDDILALLESAPYSTGRLAEHLKQAYPRVLGVCTMMAREGQIVRLPNPDRRWALSDRQFEASIRKADQPFETAALSAKKPRASSSWWIQSERARFTDQAERELPRMRSSRIADWVRGQVIAELGPRR